MSLENSFLIEFPADKDYIPFIQVFLRDFLKNFDFSSEFAERASAECAAWFSSFIPEEVFLHAIPTISFSGKSSANILSIKIQTSDNKEFITSLSSKNLEDAK